MSDNQKKNKLFSLDYGTRSQIKELSENLGISETMVVRYAIALLYKKTADNDDDIQGLNLLADE